MLRPFLQQRTRKVGLPPGTPVFTGEAPPVPPTIEVFRYRAGHLEHLTLTSMDDLPVLPAEGVLWVHLTGVHVPDILERLGERFDLHPLTVEDLANTAMRPKVEAYEHYLHIALKEVIIEAGEEAGHVSLRTNQIHVLLGKGWVVSVVERATGLFDLVLKRLRQPGSRLRQNGSDYLAYALVDVVIDSHFLFIERFSEISELLEEAILEDVREEHLHALKEYRHIGMFVRRIFWSEREAIAQLLNEEMTGFFTRKTRLFLRDVYDHIVQIVDMSEMLREIHGTIQDLYYNALSQRTNEIMKVLTIIGTIFLPITFIAGVYGMNFEYMPELHWKWGYAYALTLMALVAGGFTYYLKRRGWL